MTVAEHRPDRPEVSPSLAELATAWREGRRRRLALRRAARLAAAPPVNVLPLEPDAPPCTPEPGTIVLGARALVAHLTRSGWTASEVAAAVAVPHLVLDVVVLTGSAPPGLATALVRLLDEPVPGVECATERTARAGLFPWSGRWQFRASCAVAPEALAQVWGAAADGPRGTRLRPPAGWSALHGFLAVVRLAATGHPRCGAPAVVNVSRRHPDAQNVGAQGFVRVPTSPAELAALPLLQVGLVLRCADGQSSARRGARKGRCS